MRFNRIFLVVISLSFMLTFPAGKVSPAKKLEQKLIGTWVQKQGLQKEFLRFVRAKELEKNKSGFIFHEDGSVIIRQTFGCQMPLPNYRNWNAEWKLRNAGTVIVDRHYPGQKPEKMRIEKVGHKELLFLWK